MASGVSESEVRLVREHIDSRLARGESLADVRRALLKARVDRRVVEAAFKAKPAPRSAWYFWPAVILAALIVMIIAYLVASGR